MTLKSVYRTKVHEGKVRRGSESRVIKRVETRCANHHLNHGEVEPTVQDTGVGSGDLESIIANLTLNRVGVAIIPNKGFNAREGSGQACDCRYADIHYDVCAIITEIEYIGFKLSVNCSGESGCTVEGESIHAIITEQGFNCAEG